VGLAALAGLGLAACGGGVERIVLVSVDTLRADHVGCYGAGFAHTPTLDAAAARGVRFETAISPAPLTLPSHATLLTGLDPPEHGVRHNGIFRLADDVPTLAEHLRARGFATAAFVGAFVLERRFGLARGFDRYDDRTSRRASEGGLAGYAERPADQVIDAALAWLDTAPARFFLFVHLYDPHAEYRPPPGFAAAVPGRPYDGEIAFADAQLGRLVGAVERRFADGGTLLAFTADHGDSLGEHGERTHSLTLYDATQRVPLLLAGPGLPAGRVVAGVAPLRDVAPTLLDLAGLPPLPSASGASLRALIEGGGSREAYLETLATQLEWGWSPLLGLRTRDWKYVRAPRPELYDLRADPHETRDLAAREPARAAELDAALQAHLARARPARPTLEPGEEARARLAALGYLEPVAVKPGQLGRIGGADPKDGLATARAVHEADNLLSAGKVGEALARLEAIGEEIPTVAALLSAAALAAGEPVRAESAARGALLRQPSHWGARGRLAAALEEQGRLAEAREVYEGMTRLRPGAGIAWRRLGSLAERAGDPGSAEAHYRRAFEASDPDPSAAWRLAALRVEARAFDEARSWLARASPELREEPAAALRLARAEARAGREEEALARLASAARAHPGALDLRLGLADLLAGAGRGDEAASVRAEVLEASERALAVDGGGERGPLLLARAQALASLGRAGEARETLVELAPLFRRLRAEQRAAARELADRVGLPTDTLPLGS
jgi:arylsulfatase A-like enzyme/Flp pilus assembly protein TadD